MHVFGDIDESEIKALEQSGWVASETARRMQNTLSDFKMFCNTNEATSFDNLLQHRDKLEELLMKFFASMKVVDPNGDVADPKSNTLNAANSRLRMAILRETLNDVDIKDKIVFPRLDMMLKGKSSSLHILPRILQHILTLC